VGQPVAGACAYANTGVVNTAYTLPNNTVLTCRVRVVSASGVGSVSRTLEPWIANQNRTDAPYYKAQQFLISGQ
jgi:hypothetical protein